MDKKRLWILGFLALALFMADAASKHWVNQNLIHTRYVTSFYPYGGVGVFQNMFGIDFVINKARNTGGAWSLFSTFPKTLLVVRVGMIFFLLGHALFFNKNRKRDIPFMLIITGGLGNIADTLIYGSVVDLFHFVLWGYSFPIFNVADILIFFGVMILIVQECLKKIGAYAGQSSES